MTYAQYKSYINEKITKDEKENIDNSTVFGLLAQYNLRFIADEEKEAFKNAFLETRQDMIIDAFNSKNELEDFDVVKKLLPLCHYKVQAEFIKENEIYRGLYNVHNIVLEKELSPQRESVKKARIDGDKEMSYAKEDEKVTYIQKAKIAKDYFLILSSEESLNMLAKKTPLSTKDFKKLVEHNFIESVKDLIDPETKYLSTVVESAVLWDEKIINPANKEISKVI